MPVITSLAPASAAAGSAAQMLTINGSGFMSSSAVTYNGTAYTATYVSPSQLTIQLSAADQATAGSYAVVVTNPAPGGGISNSVDFTVGNAVPAVSALVPASVTVGAAAQTLTIDGSGFMPTSSVTYNGGARTATFVSAAQLTLALSTADQGTVGSYAVTVTNPAPGGGPSNTAIFTVAPVVPPGAAVLIMGGQSAASMPLMSGEVFASSAFASAGNMLVARYRPTATLLSGGAAILIAGGFDANGSAPKTAETYQVATKTFGAAAVAMQCAHQGHTATVLQNGQVLIAGRDGKTPCAELYDPVSGTFTRTGNMMANLSNHAAVLLQSGKVLIVGGTVDASGCTLCATTKSAELYDPALGTFAATTHTMVEVRSSPTATLLASGEVLITGGGTTPTGGPSKTAELYDPAADTFTLLASSMSVERQFHTATVLPSGDVLVAGGLTTAGSTATASADLYDPTTQTFRTTGPMVYPRLYHTATVLGNLVLIAGGTTQLTTGVGDGSAELYDATAGVFTLTGNLATGRYGAGAAPLQ